MSSRSLSYVFLAGVKLIALGARTARAARSVLQTHRWSVASRSALTVTVLGLACLSPGTICADTYAYVEDGIADLGVIDLTTGVTVLCGNSSVVLSGLGAGSDNNISGGQYVGYNFYRVNPAYGALTLLGKSNVKFYNFGSTTNALYAVDVGNRYDERYS